MPLRVNRSIEYPFNSEEARLKILFNAVGFPAVDFMATNFFVSETMLVFIFKNEPCTL